MSAPFQARVERDLVVVDGPDATSFLQGQVSQDLEPVGVGESVHTLLLQPQGKLLVDFYAVRVASDTWWCITEGGFGPALADGLNRFKIRVKAEIQSEPVFALAIRGEATVSAPDDVQVVAVDGWDGPAFDAVGSSDAIAALSAALSMPAVDADAYERARIEAGVPRQGIDVDERTIPQEAGLELVAVSFTKGCFVGQELVCRIDSRGHVNRFLRRLRADAPLARGAEVTHAGKVVGEITSASGTVALAMLRREIEPDATVDVVGTVARVEAI